MDARAPEIEHRLSWPVGRDIPISAGSPRSSMSLPALNERSARARTSVRPLPGIPRAVRRSNLRGCCAPIESRSLITRLLLPVASPMPARLRQISRAPLVLWDSSPTSRPRRWQVGGHGASFEGPGRLAGKKRMGSRRGERACGSMSTGARCQCVWIASLTPPPVGCSEHDPAHPPTLSRTPGRLSNSEHGP